MDVPKDALLDSKAVSLNMWAFAVLIIFIVVSSSIAADTYVPALPAIQKYYSTSIGLVKWSITVYMLGLAFSQLIYGPWSDRVGRKYILGVGLAVSLLGDTICIFAPSISLLIIGRGIQALGIGAAVCLPRSIATDVFQGKLLSQMVSYLSIAFGLAPAVAPIIGGYLLYHWGWQAIFIFIAIYTGVAIAMVCCYLPETYFPTARQRQEKYYAAFSHYRNLIKSPVFMCNVITSSVGLAGIIVYYSFTPFLYQNILGISPIVYGWLAVFVSAGVLIGKGINIALLRIFSMQKLVFLGNTLMLLAALCMLLIGLYGTFNVWGVILPFMLYVMGSGLIFSNAFVSAVGCFQHNKGGSASLYSFIQIFGSVVAGIFATKMMAHNQIPLAVILCVATVVSTGSLFFLMRFNKSKADTGTTIDHH